MKEDNKFLALIDVIEAYQNEDLGNYTLDEWNEILDVYGTELYSHEPHAINKFREAYDKVFDMVIDAEYQKIKCDSQSEAEDREFEAYKVENL